MEFHEKLQWDLLTFNQILAELKAKTYFNKKSVLLLPKFFKASAGSEL